MTGKKKRDIEVRSEDFGDWRREKNKKGRELTEKREWRRKKEEKERERRKKVIKEEREEKKSKR